MEPNSVVGDRTKNHLQELLLEPALTHLLTAHTDQQVITKKILPNAQVEKINSKHCRKLQGWGDGSAASCVDLRTEFRSAARMLKPGGRGHVLVLGVETGGSLGLTGQPARPNQ